MRKNVTGFTLIEVTIVVAIIAILLTIAIPAFTEQMKRSRRTEATQELQDCLLKQEKYRSNNPTYGTMAQALCTTSGLNYNFAVTLDSPAAGSFTLTATAKNQQATDTRCTPMTITRDRVKTPEPGYCWR